MIFWTSALQLAAKMDRMKQAETKLLQWAREFGDRSAFEYKISTVDTNIPRHVVPLKQQQGARRSSSLDCTRFGRKNNDSDTSDLHEDGDESLVIHAVKVETTNSNNRNNKSTSTTQTPLVLLHGYMNAAAYFYRNLVGLTHYFDTVYSLDLLGWGLSSRPEFDLEFDADNDHDSATKEENEIKATEAFYVESLEAWRHANQIDKMILAGHSMGGYMSVAYCEKYPQHVERLILLSPVGVPEETPDILQRRQAMKEHSWKVWALSGMAQNIFHYHSAGQVFRSMPTSWGETMFLNYVQKRLPAISDPDEQQAVAEYLVANNTLPGSGEHCINKFLNPYAYAKRPTEFRIPKLQVPSVTFLYGDHDWMDPRGGTVVQLKCQAQREQQPQQPQEPTPPDVSVYQIGQAGHLLMLENWREFNAAVILGAGGSLDCLPYDARVQPRKLDVNDFVSSTSSQQLSLKQRSQQSLKQQSSTASLSDAGSARSNEPQFA